MVGEWRELSIGELADIYDGPHATPPKTSDGPVFLGISNLARGRIDLANSEHLSEVDYTRWTRRVKPQEGDVVFSYETRLGEAAVIPPGLRCCLGRRMGLLRARSAVVDNRFLLYAYLGPQFQETLRSRTIHGSTVDRIPLIDMASFPIAVPASIDEQRAIAHILGTLDDKIELNRRMNETLEAMARALFKSWFVDFDPVRAKAEGRDPGMPQPLAVLFPDSFDYSELGEIPRGWEVRPLRDLTGYLSRGIGPDYIESGGVCVLNQKCIRDRRIDFSKARRHDEFKKPTNERLLRRLDVLVNSTGVGTLGRAAQVWHLPEPSIVDSHVTVLRAALEVDPWFFGIGLTGREAEIEALGEGSTGQTELSRVRLGDLLCLSPPNEVRKQFGVAASQLLERLSSAQQESTTLAALRDALLPKLISGELRVEDPDQFPGSGD